LNPPRLPVSINAVASDPQHMFDAWLLFMLYVFEIKFVFKCTVILFGNCFIYCSGSL